MPQVIRRPAAREDAIELAAYIMLDSMDEGRRFLKAVRDDCVFLAEHPGFGALRDFGRPELKGMRSWPMRDFPNHLIFYIPIPDGIEVLRVLHGARDLEAIFG